ncbi:hypothetical protein GCM10027185_55830 [Spirosoma pulveris]
MKNRLTNDKGSIGQSNPNIIVGVGEAVVCYTLKLIPGVTAPYKHNQLAGSSYAIYSGIGVPGFTSTLW